MDEVYIRKTLEGNPDAFRYLIEKYKDMAFSIAISVIKDDFYAEEIIQESFLKTFDKLDTFKSNARFSTWFYRIVVNESLKYAKRLNRSFVDITESIPEVADQHDNPEINLIRDDQRTFVNEALKMIRPDECLVLRLFYLAENSIEEIGEITGWSASNIKVLLHRGRIHLKSAFIKKYHLSKGGLY